MHIQTDSAATIRQEYAPPSGQLGILLPIFLTLPKRQHIAAHQDSL
jgi:hypothetical protein